MGTNPRVITIDLTTFFGLNWPRMTIHEYAGTKIKEIQLLPIKLDFIVHAGQIRQLGPTSVVGAARTTLSTTNCL